MRIFYLFLALFLITFMLTGIFRRYALAKNIIDKPNERSSHVIPTPRGGGMAFVFGFLLFTLILTHSFDLIDFNIAILLLTGGGMVALIGALDDHYSISPLKRLLTHLMISGLAVYVIGGMTGFGMSALGVSTRLCLDFFGILYLVWLINLYNFMDGINGLASLEAISVCLGAVIIYGITSHLDMIWLPLLLSVGILGFLFWNFPKARIFMGDGGSGFLGFTLGVFSLQAAELSTQLFWSWLILLGVFIVDATTTLLRRLLLGDKIYQAHCSHAYQHASRKWNSHSIVSLAILGINIFWLLPIAMFVARDKIMGEAGLVIAYFPLILLALFFKAGKKH